MLNKIPCESQIGQTGMHFSKPEGHSLGPQWNYLAGSATPTPRACLVPMPEILT